MAPRHVESGLGGLGGLGVRWEGPRLPSGGLRLRRCTTERIARSNRQADHFPSVTRCAQLAYSPVNSLSRMDETVQKRTKEY